MHNLGMFMNYPETKCDKKSKFKHHFFKNIPDITFVIKHSLTQTRTQISIINNLIWYKYVHVHVHVHSYKNIT